jgi:hypothetical protein
MDDHLTSTQAQSTPALPASTAGTHYSDYSSPPDAGDPDQEKKTKRIAIISIVVIAFLIALLIGFFLWLALPSTNTAKVRDIFIIFMALQSMLLGLAMIVLIIQLARLTNLLQNEIKPILDSTNETVSNLRGTTVFLSDNLVGPVIKMNEYLAGFSQFVSVLGLAKKPKSKSSPKGE